jgi:hypothetical protein
MPPATAATLSLVFRGLMKFVDTYVFRDDRFSIGTEEESGVHYLSIPVSNGLVEYEEYYALDPVLFARAPGNIEQLRAFAEECRQHHMDDRLIVKPGTRRGLPI